MSSQPPSIEATSSPAPDANSPRDVKRKTPVLGESIKMVATQLLDTNNVTAQAAIVSDSRIPPKVKNQLATKQKIKTRLEEITTEKIENGHAGIAVPVTMEELESENKIVESSSESSTSNEGISTWILLSNPTAKENNTMSTEPTKVEEVTKKNKPNNKNKTKRPAQNGNKPAVKRPIIASSNKSDLIAGGSAINDNVLNKIKDTVLSNVQKNKNTQTTTQKPTTLTTTTTTTPMVEITTTKKEEVTKAPVSVIPVVKVTAKPTKKKNKIKQKVTSTTTTEEPVFSDSALLPAEAKEQEIELEISTPATTTKKPKRKSSTKRKKSKTKKRKTSTKTPKPEETAVAVKTTNKTKTVKPAKKPESPITTQIYNYLSREVMPSVGVGAIGLVGLVGLASYFLYPFATPVRRTFEVDKKDDIYRHNAEEYASEGNGQAEEEMLGTVLAGMPAHSKHKLNPYIGQMANANRYPTKKEQDLKYRHVASSYDSPNYNVHYPQQKTGIAHAAVYSEPNYSPQQQQYENRHVYTTEGKYTYEKPAYTQYPAVEPIYAAPQTGPSGAASYESDTSNSVVYGVKPSAETDFKPVYPFEGQVFSDTTSNPMTYPPTSMYLGSNNEAEQQEEAKYSEEIQDNDNNDSKFVVGNVPKEISETATPAVVPEHGPRTLRRRRNAVIQKRSLSNNIEEILKAAKAENKDGFMSNEIDEALGDSAKNIMNSMATTTETKIQEGKHEEKANVRPIYAVSLESKTENYKITTEEPTNTPENKFVESVSTLPLDTNKSEQTTPDTSNELDFTTKSFRVFEVFSSDGPEKAVPIEETKENIESTTEYRNMNTETTTEIFKSETTSTMPSLTSTVEAKLPTETESPNFKPNPTNNPNTITYPPSNGDGSFFTFLKRLVEFKYRLGLSILQTTSDSLNRYLRNMEGTVQRMASASKPL